MHLVRGMTSLNTKKRKQKRKPGWKQAQLEHEKFLNSMGIDPKRKKKKGEENVYRVQTEPYQRNEQGIGTSDVIPTGSTARRNGGIRYTGTEIVGIATMHKSNAVPVRRGTNEAVEIANMRR